jgi:protein-S-isoprenylcysteine O-methyltransferase Ste14
VKLDWRALREHHRIVFVLIVLGKTLRTKVGLLLAVACVAAGFYLKKTPLDLAKPNVWVVVGLLLIVAGVAFRFAAYGCLKKKEVLATNGVYSLCRHPLYLGSLLLTYGFCFLLNKFWYFVAATIYFLIFYPLTIVWEEIRLAERYGADHEQYARATPALLPLGKFQPGVFQWSLAMRKGGGVLLGVAIALLVVVEILAKKMGQI